ncbi:MAG: ribosome assembly RNA-binding protein YhbY [Gammaproteobacteria bacterium]|nr:ribosome assembly RNA-binding protein YhbY [Gammaproteobacteria bacterium]
MAVDKQEKRALKAKAHALKPVVMIGQNGLNANVIAEINVALDHHELIKVKVAAERHDREQFTREIITQTAAELIQSMGQMITLYREKPEEE